MPESLTQLEAFQAMQIAALRAMVSALYHTHPEKPRVREVFLAAAAEFQAGMVTTGGANPPTMALFRQAVDSLLDESPG